MDYFKYFPVDIALDILSRVPTEPVLECKLVCTDWRNHIRDPLFSKLHLHHLDSGKFGFLAITTIGYVVEKSHHYFEYNDEPTTSPVQKIRRINLTFPVWGSRLVGSCNGLICFARGPCVWICNPITREQVTLPEIERDCNIHGNRLGWTCGFGYISSTDEYKVVGIDIVVTSIVDVYIYTLSSGVGWRKLGKFDFEASKVWEQGIFANGALYWLDRMLDIIITFDLAEEKFCEHLSLPPLPQHGGWWDYYRIGVLDGFLYISVRQGGNRTDVWLLKEKSVNREMEEQEEHRSSGWIKEFTIDNSTLFAVMKSNGVLTYIDNYLKIYDPKTSTSKRLVKFKDLLLRVCPHQNTLVSLKELGEEDTITMESVETKETRCGEQLQEYENLE